MRKILLYYVMESYRIQEINIIVCGNYAVIHRQQIEQRQDQHVTKHINVSSNYFSYYCLSVGSQKSIV